jgi:putative molybdopterin biosynthesis protein
MKRKYYLNSVDLTDAQDIIKDLSNSLSLSRKVHTISVYDSLHKITSKSIFAKLSSPMFNASAMDGIATKSTYTLEASENNPITLTKDQYIYINTGNIVPNEFDTVIMIEDINELPNNSISIIKSHGLFENIRPIGEDVTMGELIIPKNKKITPVDIAALLAGGIIELEVYQPLHFVIIPTGDEIVKSTLTLQKGQIIDSNSYYIKNELQLLGIECDILNTVEDKYEILEETILNASTKYDLVLIGAGSSAGSKDYVSHVVSNNGSLLVHGISIKPGKPTIIGTINNTPLIGLPGYPVSTYLAYHLIVKQLAYHMLGIPMPYSKTIKAKLTKKIYSTIKEEEYIRVKLGKVQNEIVATPLDRGAGITMSLVKADGFIISKKLSEGFLKEDYVDVTLINNHINIDNNLVSIGSHDIILDIINDQMNDLGFSLSSSHVGSFSGILSIKNNECHIAPVHILHTDGTYNSFIIDKYLDDNYHIIKGIERIQGLYIKKGNPKQIKNISDLTRKDISFVNRQKGSGTRILLDHILQENNINKEDINGYNYELTTHTLVAASIKDERYDTGLGVKSVANLYDLDFIEIGKEHYDFIIHKSILNDPTYQTFIHILQSDLFKEKLEHIGGYIIHNPGHIII